MKTVRELIAELQKEDQDAPVIAFYWLPADLYFDEWEAEPMPTADEFRQVDVFRGQEYESNGYLPCNRFGECGTYVEEDIWHEETGFCVDCSHLYFDQQLNPYTLERRN